MFNQNKNLLKKEIQRKRQELIEIGTRKGLQNNVTVLLSQELDRLIIEYQKRFK